MNMNRSIGQNKLTENQDLIQQQTIRIINILHLFIKHALMLTYIEYSKPRDSSSHRGGRTGATPLMTDERAMA